MQREDLLFLWSFVSCLQISRPTKRPPTRLDRQMTIPVLFFNNSPFDLYLPSGRTLLYYLPVQLSCSHPHSLGQPILFILLLSAPVCRTFFVFPSHNDRRLLSFFLSRQADGFPAPVCGVDVMPDLYQLNTSRNLTYPILFRLSSSAVLS